MSTKSTLTRTAVLVLLLVGVLLLRRQYVLLSVAAILPTWLTYTVFIYPFYVSPLKRLPEPEGASRLTGHAKILTNERSGLHMDDWENCIPNDGMLRYRTALNRENVLVTGSKPLAEVLVHKSYDFAKPAKLRVGLGRILGVGLIVSEGDQHKTQRKQLMPAFAFRHIKELYPEFWNKASYMASVLSRHILTQRGEPVVEISSWLARTTLDIIGVAGLGQDFGAIDDPDNEVVGVYRNVFEPKRQPSAFSIIKVLVIEKLSTMLPIRPPNLSDSILGAAEALKGVARTLVRNKMSKVDKQSQLTEADQDKDIISVALRSGFFSEDDMVNQVMTFLAAGHETTATSLTWAVLALCQNTSIQVRLRAEIRAFLPSPTGATSITPEQIDSLPYLRATCAETFRFYPPAGITKRVAIRDTFVNDTLIPKGTTVIISPRATNHSIALWGDDAMAFKPERWLNEQNNSFIASGGADSNYAMLTFLHGPRSCIGEKFARAEFACLLATLVGRFEMHLADPLQAIEFETGLTTKPKGGLNVTMKVVEGW